VEAGAVTVSAARGKPSFELQFPPEQLRPLAGRFGDTDDDACEAAGAAARRRGYYTREEFLTVCEWKTSRSRPKVERNPAATVERNTRQALGAADEGERMHALIQLEGVGVPTASTLLHFARPDDYPILDVRALESLGQNGRSVYPVAYWLDYLHACRRLAQRHGVSVRTLDKALWQHSKERGSGADDIDSLIA
jgi:hypothetical protein